MRLNADSQVRLLVSVYLNGKKESNAVEVYVPGNALEGRGYVVRMVHDENDRAIATITQPKPLPPGRYDDNGALCEKVFGEVRIEFEEELTRFEDN